MMHARILVWCLPLALVPSAAVAQTADRDTRQVGAAVEWSSLVEGWGGSASVRFWHGRLGLDIAAASWRAQRRRDLPAAAGASTVEDTSESAWSAGVSAVARAAAGRFAVVGGAGPALFSKTIATRTTFDGVEKFNTRTQLTAVGFRFLLQAEVEIAARTQAFAGARVDLPDLRTPGLTPGVLSAGLRLRF
jgi:hypothetical protein